MIIWFLPHTFLNKDKKFYYIGPCSAFRRSSVHLAASASFDDKASRFWTIEALAARNSSVTLLTSVLRAMIEASFSARAEVEAEEARAASGNNDDDEGCSSLRLTSVSSDSFTFRRFSDLASDSSRVVQRIFKSEIEKLFQCSYVSSLNFDIWIRSVKNSFLQQGIKPGC